MRDLRALTRQWRVLIAVAVLLAVAAVAVFAGNQILALKDRLADEPVWLQWLVAVVGVAVLGTIAAGLKRTLFPPVRKETAAHPPVPDEAELRARVTHWQARGVDVKGANAELAELDRRRGETAVYVAVYGVISSGKSALIRALAPGASADSGVTGGTTEQVTHHEWRSGEGDRLILADVPGFGQVDGGGEIAARDEAERADVVLFVAEGDLTRPEFRALERLRRLGKPLVVAVNKMDRYRENERTAVLDRLRERVGSMVPVVPVVAGGTIELIRRDASGREERVQRERPPDVRGLRRALQRVRDDAAGLGERRDRAVFLLTARKLEGAVRAHRRDAADALVERYARRAVVGALAAVAPGSDLVIQGGLATALVRELCTLYEISWREVAVERFITGLRERTRTATPLLLGVAGNALKAFPGVGTLAGGVVHAVAYGLLFRTVGRALVDSLEARGELRADDALERFEEALREDMAKPARGLAQVALADRGSSARDSG